MTFKHPQTFSDARNIHNQHLLDSADYADLTVRCQEESYRVHRAIVCACPFFAGACGRGFEEAQTGIIDMSHDEPQTVKALLQYLYTGQYTRDDATSLLFLAKLYTSSDMHDVPGLKACVTQDFSRHVRAGLKDDDSKLDFLDAVLYIYDNTVESDRSLRQAAVECFLKSAKELFTSATVAPRSRQILRECPDFAVDVALATAGVRGEGDEVEMQRDDELPVTVAPVAAQAGGYESSDEDGFV